MTNQLFVLLLALASTHLQPAFAQQPPDTADSVPDPTAFSTIVSHPDTVEVSAVVAGELRSIDSTLRATNIDVMDAAGEIHSGLRIRLIDPGQTDFVYLSNKDVSRLQDELEHMMLSRKHEEPCTARYACMHGIARCRPSQTVTQAYCPGRIIRPNRDEGFALSTPRNNFTFPEITIDQVNELISRSVRLREE